MYVVWWRWNDAVCQLVGLGRKRLVPLLWFCSHLSLTIYGKCGLRKVSSVSLCRCVICVTACRTDTNLLVLLSLFCSIYFNYLIFLPSLSSCTP